MDTMMTTTDNSTWTQEGVHSIIISCNAWKVKYDYYYIDYPIQWEWANSAYGEISEVVLISWY